MTPQQKAVCRELLALSYEGGFGARYPLAPIAAKLKIKRKLYDNNTNTGVLWDLGKHGKGYLDIANDGSSAGVLMENRGMLARYCDFRG